MAANYVWCTLVMCNDKYAIGAAVVAESLRGVETKYPIWCMVTNEVSKECKIWLEIYFDKIVEVPVIKQNVKNMKSKKQRLIYGSWINQSFTRWNALNPELFPVDKIITLDADMLFIENCDILFELEPPALTFSNPWASTYMKKGYGLMNPYGEMKHGSLVKHSAIRRGLKRSFVGLGCMALLRPSKLIWETMNTILNCKVYGHDGCASGFDEQIIAEVHMVLDMKIYHIHQQYNWYTGKNNWLKEGMTPKTYQWYVSKPWKQNREDWPDLDIWYMYIDTMSTTDPEVKHWLEYARGE